MNEIQQACLMAFAATYKFFQQAQIAHWNVEGKNFPQYHELFGDIYGEVYGTIDSFAERIRTLQVTIPKDFVSKSPLLEELMDSSDMEELVRGLFAANEAMNVVLKNAYTKLEDAGEVGFSNYIAERIDAHRKHGWMLRSCLK